MQPTFHSPATYNRVSTEEQSRDQDALKRMLYHSEKTLAKFGFTEARQYVDVQSGKDDTRPEFERLVAEIQAKTIDLLILYRIDRFTRRTATNAQLAEVIAKNGIKIYEITSGKTLDLNQRGDWEYFVSAGVKAQSEVMELSARVRLGLDFSRHQGNHIGKIPFGYIRVKGKLQIDETVQDLCLGMIDIFIREPSISEAARKIKEELDHYIAASSLHRWVHSILIQGHMRRGDEIIYNNHPAILTAEKYKLIVEKNLEVKARYNNIFKKKYTHLFSGLLRCGYCNRNVTAKATTTRYGVSHIYYRCEANIARMDCEVRFNKSGNKTIPETTLENVLIAALGAKATEITNAAIEGATQTVLDPEIENIQKQIRSIQKFIAENGDQFGLMRQQVMLLEAQMKSKASSPTIIDEVKRQEIVNLAADPELWSVFSREEKKQIYREIFKVVWVRGNEVVRVEFREF